SLQDGTVVPRVRADETVDMDAVKNRDDDVVLIDSRSYDRYLGHTEPMYKKSGHIPGAMNSFWKGVLKADGSWKDTDELKAHFRDIPEDKEIVVSCGSGVSACPNV